MCRCQQSTCECYCCETTHRPRQQQACTMCRPSSWIKNSAGAQCRQLGHVMLLAAASHHTTPCSPSSSLCCGCRVWRVTCAANWAPNQADVWSKALQQAHAVIRMSSRECNVNPARQSHPQGTQAYKTKHETGKKTWHVTTVVGSWTVQALREALKPIMI